jgi:hypothetical protein
MQMEKMSADDLVYLVGHRGAVAHKLNCVMLELSIAPTPEDAAAGKSLPIMVVIPADYAEKVIASIQVSLSRLRQTN